MDPDGTATVSAREKSSGNSKSVVIAKSDRIGAEDIEPLIEEAERYDEQDGIHRARHASRRKLENYNYSIKRQLRAHVDIGSKAYNDDRKYLADAVQRIEDWLDIEGSTAVIDDIEEQFRRLIDRVERVAERPCRLDWWFCCRFWCW